jgi:hypothetical protein
LVFGNDAWTIAIKICRIWRWGLFIPVAGLQLAMDLLEEKEYQQTNFYDYGR